MRLSIFASAFLLLSTGLAALPTASAVNCDGNFNREYVTYEICKAVVDGDWEPLRLWVQARIDEAQVVVDLVFEIAERLGDLAFELIVCLTGGPCPK